MPKTKLVKSSLFKQGNPGGPGRPKMPESLKAVQSIPKEIVGKIIDNFWSMKVSELEYLLDIGELNAMETAIAKQVKLATEGSLYSVMFLLDRRYGKPVDGTNGDGEDDESIGTMLAKWKDIDPKDHIALIRQGLKKEGNG